MNLQIVVKALAAALGARSQSNGEWANPLIPVFSPRLGVMQEDYQRR
jgi:hypothetical protein